MVLFGLPDGDGSSWFGQLFVMFCYGYILFKAAVLIGSGSEKLLLIYGPGIVGGLVIPVLGAVPDGAIVLVSGLGSASEAQCQVSIGVGTLAGSTIMLLTLPWAGALFLGWRDQDPLTGKAASLKNGKPKATDGFKIASSCVTTFANTVSGAILMLITSISYLIVLIPAMIFKSAPPGIRESTEHYPALVGFIVCAIAFTGYSIFQLVDSKAQTTQEMKKQKLVYAKWKGEVGARVASTETAIKLAFKKFDTDGNNLIDRSELQEGFKCLGLELGRGQVMEIMEEFNTDDDKDSLTESEFTKAISKWSQKLLSTQTESVGAVMKKSAISSKNVMSDADSGGVALTENREQKVESDQLLEKTKQKKGYHAVDGVEVEHDDDDDEEHVEQFDMETNDRDKIVAELWRELQQEDDDEDQMLHLTNKQLIRNAMIELMIGTFMVVIFSDPMVSAIGIFADTINCPAFYVSFIVTPVASNASEIYSSLLFARKKTTEGISMGFSALYGAACMNNTFVLCIFCALVFFRELQWTFITETLVILLTIIVVGANGMRKTVYVWQGLVVVIMFPLSLILVAILDPLLDDVVTC